jgi:PepSY-associated TM region
MSAWQLWMEHPERVWVRKCLFYIHLLVGAGAGLYIVLMSITGSLIVYRNGLEKVPSLVSSVEWIFDLHENLLFGMNGRSVNGIGAICVIVLCLTGAVIWWPGINNWRRALTVNWRAFFARFTWDLHSALGFWGFLFVLMWGITGFYFCFPEIVNALSGFVDPSDKYADRVLGWVSMAHFGRFKTFPEAKTP